MGVHDADAFCAAANFVVDDLNPASVGQEGHVSGCGGGGEGGGVAAEITAIWAATGAKVAVVAGAAAFPSLAEVGNAGDGDDAVGIVLADLFAEMVFDAIHFHGRKEFAVGQVGKAFG